MTSPSRVHLPMQVSLLLGPGEWLTARYIRIPGMSVRHTLADDCDCPRPGRHTCATFKDTPRQCVKAPPTGRPSIKRRPCQYFQRSSGGVEMWVSSHPTSAFPDGNWILTPFLASVLWVGSHCSAWLWTGFRSLGGFCLGAAQNYFIGVVGLACFITFCLQHTGSRTSFSLRIKFLVGAHLVQTPPVEAMHLHYSTLGPGAHISGPGHCVDQNDPGPWSIRDPAIYTRPIATPSRACQPLPCVGEDQSLRQSTPVPESLEEEELLTLLECSLQSPGNEAFFLACTLLEVLQDFQQKTSADHDRFSPDQTPVVLQLCSHLLVTPVTL